MNTSSVSTELPSNDEILTLSDMTSEGKILVTYSVRNSLKVAISIIDYQRQVHQHQEIVHDRPTFGSCELDSTDLASGSYLIKIKFEDGKTSYRQVTR